MGMDRQRSSRLIDPVGGMQYPAIEFAFVLDIPSAVVVKLWLVIDLRFVVLFGDLGLKVRVAVLQVEQVDRVGAQARQISYSIVTTDRFGRYVVMAWAGLVNLSCWQLQRAQAIYKPRWDNGGLVDSTCR